MGKFLAKYSFWVLLVVVYLVIMMNWVGATLSKPLTVDEQIGDASLFLEAASAYVPTEATCFMVRWDVSGIEAIYLNERGQIGQGEQEVCYHKLYKPEFDITLQDGTELHYRLRVIPIFDLWQFWVFVIVGIVLFQLPLFLATCNPLDWLSSLGHHLKRRPRMWAVMILVMMLYVVLATVFAPPYDMIEHPDSRYYLSLADFVGVTSLSEWDAVRPAMFPIIYSLLNQDLALIGIVQFTTHVVLWGLFAWTVASLMQSANVRVVTLMVLLGFALSVTMLHWWRVLLTESFTHSLTVLIIAAGIIMIRYLTHERRSVWRQALLAVNLLLLLFVWIFFRDIHIYAVVALVGLIVLLFIGFKRVRQHLPVFLIVLVVGSCLLAYDDHTRSTETKRWKFPLVNLIIQRIIPDEDALLFFEDHGLPMVAELSPLSGAVQVYADVDTYADFDQWVDEHGRDVYLQYLLSRPKESVLEPLQQADVILLTQTDLRVNSRTETVPLLQQVVTDVIMVHGSHLYVLSLGVILFAMVVVRRYGVDWRWLLPIGMLWLVYPLGFISWHGDSGDVERHSLLAALYFRLGIWLLFLLAIDLVVQSVNRYKHL